MNDTQKRILKYLRMSAKRDGNPLQKSQQQLADELKLSRPTIHNNLKILQAGGHITMDISELQRPKIIVNGEGVKDE